MVNTLFTHKTSFYSIYNNLANELDPNNKNAQDLVLSIFTPENGIVFGLSKSILCAKNHVYYLRIYLFIHCSK